MSRRVLVTGASGFAGGHLVAACAAAGDDVIALTRSAAAGHAFVADLRDPPAARAAVAQAAPDVVFHLAALAHVGRSWRDPATTLADNQSMTLAVLDAVRTDAPDALVVVVSSGEVYGPPATLPVDESAALRPQNPYAVSKAAADLLAGFYADAHGLRVVRARAFNHAGPGQPPLYALASFTRQVAAGIEAGDDPIALVTGNPDARRDYTDVRDVVRAYRLLAEAGEPGVVQRLLGPLGLPARADRAARAHRRSRDRPPRRPGARARARGDGDPRQRGAPARRYRLGAGDRARDDAGRHRRLVARGDPRRPRRRRRLTGYGKRPSPGRRSSSPPSLQRPSR